jgi:SAM-dependent methyltransferase
MKNVMRQQILDEISHIPFDKIAKIVFSGTSGDIIKLTIKPLLLKGEYHWQCEKIINKQAFHINIEYAKLNEFIDSITINNDFSEINLFLIDKNIVFHVSGNKKIIKRIISLDKTNEIALTHNKEKKHILSEGMHIEALVDLGVFDANYKIKKGKYEKFVQINKFIETINDQFKNHTDKELTIVDFGCGKSYLTFIIYYYFSVIKKINVKIIGYDLKSNIINKCNEIAKKYMYHGITFLDGDIATMELYTGKVDMIITLHACDTATDYALYYAIKNKIQYIFSVPCCQQELNQQIKFNDELSIIGEHGLYKERFSAILTDCIRCEILKSMGYDVDVIEFVDFTNTPKNAMIRAKLVKRHSKADFSSIESIVRKYEISPKLFLLINNRCRVLNPQHE